MMDKGLGPSASEAGSGEVSLGVPPMSKAERLHRWADSLELQKQLQREANADAALGRRDGWCAMQTDSSPLTIAFEDWAFQAEGLRSDQLDDALAFFDLSEGEMQRITGSFYGSRTVPAALAARRVRAGAAGRGHDSATDRRTRCRQLGCPISSKQREIFNGCSRPARKRGGRSRPWRW
jgi:hypothetical protein